MDTDSALAESTITLGELKSLGEFVRCQDVKARVAGLVAAGRLGSGYPLTRSRLPANEFIDLFTGKRWERVKFVRREGTPLGGDERIVYLDQGQEKKARYDWYEVAPAGQFTDWTPTRPASVAGAKLLESFELAQQGHVLHSQELEKEDWPYLTFATQSYHRDARSVDHMWHGSYSVHAADPRVAVPGVAPREPWYNTTIAVSHRWLARDHPDPDGAECRELIEVSEALSLSDSQAFLIDYCALPQKPRTAEEDAWFKAHQLEFQSQYKRFTLVLNTGSADYARRAWCMFELVLAALSPTPRPALLNHDRLDEPLRGARELAEEYVRQAGWNRQGMARAFGGGVTRASYGAWSGDLTNVAIYNAAIEGRQRIREIFEKELEVSYETDRPVIVDLLDRLVFR